MKRCPKCGERKALGKFYACSKSKDGKSGYCKGCSHKTKVEWMRTHPERRREIYARDAARKRQKRRAQATAREA